MPQESVEFVNWKNEKSPLISQGACILWCREPESNRHALRRGILSPVRLPVPPSRQRTDRDYDSTATTLQVRALMCVQMAVAALDDQQVGEQGGGDQQGAGGVGDPVTGGAECGVIKPVQRIEGEQVPAAESAAP